MKRTTKIALAMGVTSVLYGQTSTTNAPVFNISTVAGIASAGDLNPNDPTSGRANNAVLIQPDAVVFDYSGNMYIADSAAHRVRRVDAVTGLVTTVAGTGNNAYSATEDAKGAKAVNARLNTPAGLAFDPAGNLYIVDKGNHRIRKIDSAGNITTVAGAAPINNASGSPQAVTGGTTSGYAGDNRLATFAHLNSPSAISFDPAGNMYIADTSNNRIRKVGTNGIITTFAGTGPAGFSGDGGPAVLARLNAPEGVLADVNGNVFISDTANQRVRLVTPNGLITTIAGACLPLSTRNPVTGQNVPTPCTTGTRGPNGNASASGFGFPGIGGGDNGPATSAALNNPRGLALDVNGNLYVADAGNNRIRVISPAGVITTFAGGGSGGDGAQALRASLSNPRFVAIDPATGTVAIADSNNGRVRAVDPGTLVIRNLIGGVLGSGEGVPATAARIINPRGVAVDAAGNVYISDTGSNRIRKVSGGIITTIAGTGAAGFSGDLSSTVPILATSAAVNQPSCIAVTPGGVVYFADRNNNRIRRIDPDGNINTIAGRARTAAENLSNGGVPAAPTLSGDTGPAINALLNSPNCVALDHTGTNLIVADTGNNAIRSINLTTGIINTIGGNNTVLNSLCLVPAVPLGQFVPPDSSVPSGLCSGNAGDGGPATLAQFNGPQGVAVDLTGNIFIADTGNHTVREILTNGIIQIVAGIAGSSGSDGDAADNTTGLFSATLNPPYIGSRLSSPQGVTTDPGGNIFIADTNNNRIRRVNAAQTYIHCVAGCGTNVPAVFPSTEDARGNTSIVFQPSAINSDTAGNIYFTDRIGVIRKLTPR